MPGSSMPGDRETARKWRAVLGNVEMVLPPARFAYLKESEVVQVGDDALRIAVRSIFAADWLRQCSGERFSAEIERQWGRSMALEFVPPVTESPAAALFAAAPQPPATSILSALNPGHTFDRYVVGETNRMAHEAAMALANADTWQPTPLVIIGEPGVGKTHLLEALAWHSLAREWPVVCLRWFDFVNQFVGSMKSERIDTFKAGVRGARMLIVDDLRDVSTAPRSADELGNAIEAVEATGGIVVVSAERRPAELGLPARLVSRLEKGLCIEVAPFGWSERLEYARQFCSETSNEAPEWALERLAHWEACSVRSLRGALNALTMLHRVGRLDAATLDLELAKRTLGERNPAKSAKTILAVVSRHFGISEQDLLSRDTTSQVRDARAMAAAALYRSGLSHKEVATQLRREKSTSQGLVPRGEELLAANPALRAALAG